MSKQNIPAARRFALWRAHKERCLYCGEPLAFGDLWVDHIVPEALLTRSEELERVLREYDLGLDFDIQDYCNWLPSHSRCNLKKGETLFERGAVLYFVSIARSKATTAREEEER